MLSCRTANLSRCSAGLGLRRELLPELLLHVPADLDFFELAPENWMGLGGRSRAMLDQLASQRPWVCHGLSLSLGGLAPLDRRFLRQLKTFFRAYPVLLYTEHLSYCTDHAGLYDLLPMPMTADSVKHVAARIRQVQETLERRIAIENASFYVWAPINEMDEASFIAAVLQEADCDLHLDINNVYVNSVNHRYDPQAFIDVLPSERIVYGHVAGHLRQKKHLIIDTHGADVIDPVWQLLRYSYQRHGVFPTLLERDFNIPPLAELMHEVQHIRALQAEVST